MKRIPFFPNPDNWHCLQVCVQMVLKYFYPERDFPLPYIDSLFSHENNTWSIPAQAAYVFTHFGLPCKYYHSLDEKKWSEEYVRNAYPKDVASNIIQHVDFERDRCFIEWVKDLFEQKKLSFQDIEEFFGQDYIILAVLNMSVFDNKPGYQGHFVVLTDIQNDNVVFHDPGPEPIADRSVPKKDFINAWEAPGTNSTVVLVRLP